MTVLVSEVPPAASVPDPLAEALAAATAEAEARQAELDTWRQRAELLRAEIAAAEAALADAVEALNRNRLAVVRGEVKPSTTAALLERRPAASDADIDRLLAPLVDVLNARVLLRQEFHDLAEKAAAFDKSPQTPQRVGRLDPTAADLRWDAEHIPCLAIPRRFIYPPDGY